MSNPFGGFNQRPVEEPTPKPVTPRSEGKAAPTPPTYAGYKTSHRDLVPSEAPVLDLPSASTISNGVAAALNRLDREQALVNGVSEEEFNAGLLRKTLAQGVATAQMTEAQAQALFAIAYPNLDPATLKVKS